MKRQYIKPCLEVYTYMPEKGFAHTVALHKDYVLIEGNDRNTRRASEEITEFTDDNGEYTIGLWE